MFTQIPEGNADACPSSSMSEPHELNDNMFLSMVNCTDQSEVFFDAASNVIKHHARLLTTTHRLRIVRRARRV